MFFHSEAVRLHYTISAVQYFSFSYLLLRIS